MTVTGASRIVESQDGTPVENAVPVAAPSAPYDPETETDQLIRTRITRDSVTGEAVFRSVDYPVWAIVLNLRGADDGGEDVLRLFPGLSAEDLWAANRFWALHSDDIRDRLE